VITGIDPEATLTTLRAAVDDAGGVRPFARKHNLSAAYVSRATRGQMTIGAKLAATIGLEPVTVFVPAARGGR